jgi:acetyl-CoA carboxylase carboxyltransferase component
MPPPTSAASDFVPPLLAPPLRSRLDPRTEEFQQNRTAMLEKLEEIERLHDEAEQGGGPAHHERLAKRGKLPVRERLALALDPDSPFLEISPLAGYDSDYAMGGGAVMGIGIIAGIECVIFANDPTVLGGALTPYVAKKWMRALEIARDNRIPYVSFVESAGADLRMDGDGDGQKKRRPPRTTHFAESGRFFYEMIELSKLRIPVVCVVFG